MKFLKRNIIMIAVLAFMFCSVGSHATTDYTQLTKDKKKVSTMTIFNVSGSYRFVCTSGTTSKHNVEAVLYKGESEKKINKAAWRLDKIKPGQCKTKDLDISKALYPAQKATTYGNSEDTPKTKCIATTGLANLFN